RGGRLLWPDGGRARRPLHRGGGARLVRQRRARGAADVRLLDPLFVCAVHRADPRPGARPAGRSPGMNAPSLPATAPEDLRRRRQRARNLALLAVLLGLVALIYVISIVRMGGTS